MKIFPNMGTLTEDFCIFANKMNALQRAVGIGASSSGHTSLSQTR